MVRRIAAGVLVLACAGVLAGCAGGHGAARGCVAGGHVMPSGARVVVDGQGDAWTVGSRVPGVVLTCRDGGWVR